MKAIELRKETVNKMYDTVNQQVREVATGPPFLKIHMAVADNLSVGIKDELYWQVGDDLDRHLV